MTRLACLAFVAVAVWTLVGCGMGSNAKVTPDEEERFKHPQKVDASKIPPEAFKSKGPAYIGEPTQASGSPNSPLPPAASGR